MRKLTLTQIVTACCMLAAPLFFSSCGNTNSGASQSWSGGSDIAGAPPAPAPATLGKARTARAERAAQQQRPGLGTGWGNTVSSRIGYGNFVRASSKPKGIATIYYNDKEGVNAMANNWKHSGSGMQLAAGGLVEWGVKSGWGSLKNYHSGGKRYVVGRKGSNYSIVVKNRCHSALEVVISVDGLDVMDGRSASTRKRGYIIQPGKTLTVAGFRTSESAVAAFKFSSVANSYSNLRHGTTRNVGVIGMAVFTQKGVDPWKWSRRAVRNRHGASPFAEAPYFRAR